MAKREAHERQKLESISKSLAYKVFKQIVQLYFNLYDKESMENINSFKSILNILFNSSKQEFKSLKANLQKVKPEHVDFVNNYESERDDYLIAGNAFLTLLRAQAFKLNFASDPSQ